MPVLDQIFKDCAANYDKCVTDAVATTSTLIQKIEIDNCLYSERNCLFSEMSRYEAQIYVSTLHLFYVF